MSQPGIRHAAGAGIHRGDLRNCTALDRPAASTCRSSRSSAIRSAAFGSPALAAVSSHFMASAGSASGCPAPPASRPSRPAAGLVALGGRLLVVGLGTLPVLGEQGPSAKAGSNIIPMMRFASTSPWPSLAMTSPSSTGGSGVRGRSRAAVRCRATTCCGVRRPVSSTNCERCQVLTARVSSGVATPSSAPDQNFSHLSERWMTRPRWRSARTSPGPPGRAAPAPDRSDRRPAPSTCPVVGRSRSPCAPRPRPCRTAVGHRASASGCSSAAPR